MKIYIITYFILICICIKPKIILGQTISDNVIIYKNGNSLKIKDSVFILNSGSNTVLGVWNNEGAVQKFNNSKIKKIFKINGLIKKEGLFDSENGVLIAPPIYDILFVQNFYSALYLTKIDQKIGLINAVIPKTLNVDYDEFYYYYKEKYLLKKGNVAYVINEKLEIYDSILGFVKTHKVVSYIEEKPIQAVYLKTGIALFDTENKLLVSNKEWAKVHEEMAGVNLIASTKAGFGLYNLITKVNIEPFQNTSFECKPFFNEQILFGGRKNWKLYDSSGKILLVIKADSAMPALNDWAGFFYKKGKKWGLISLEGKILQKPIWKEVLYPHLEAFQGILSNGAIVDYIYNYKKFGNKSIISKVFKNTFKSGDVER